MKRGDIMLIEQPQLRPEVSIRWLTIACFEIRVGDFRIVIDPCIGESPRAPFGPEVIEGADIVLLSHTHWDHITDLAYVMEKFHCPVLCGELSAPALIEMLNANPHDVYPVTPNLELDFGGARVRALFARHTNQHCTHADLTDPAHQRPWVNTPQRLACGNFGDLEYRDYLITTPGGLKIMFWGSNATPEQLGIIRELKPDIAIMQFTKQTPEDLAAMAEAGGVKVLIPHHMDLAMSEDVYLPRIEEMERTVHARMPGCTVITPERLKWYHMGLSIWA